MQVMLPGSINLMFLGFEYGARGHGISKIKYLSIILVYFIRFSTGMQNLILGYKQYINADMTIAD